MQTHIDQLVKNAKLTDDNIKNILNDLNQIITEYENGKNTINSNAVLSDLIYVISIKAKTSSFSLDDFEFVDLLQKLAYVVITKSAIISTQQTYKFIAFSAAKLNLKGVLKTMLRLNLSCAGQRYCNKMILDTAFDTNNQLLLEVLVASGFISPIHQYYHTNGTLFNSIANLALSTNNLNLFLTSIQTISFNTLNKLYNPEYIKNFILKTLNANDSNLQNKFNSFLTNSTINYHLAANILNPILGFNVQKINKREQIEHKIIPNQEETHAKETNKVIQAPSIDNLDVAQKQLGDTNNNHSQQEEEWKVVRGKKSNNQLNVKQKLETKMMLKEFNSDCKKSDENTCNKTTSLAATVKSITKEDRKLKIKKKKKKKNKKKKKSTENTNSQNTSSNLTEKEFNDLMLESNPMFAALKNNDAKKFVESLNGMELKDGLLYAINNYDPKLTLALIDEYRHKNNQQKTKEQFILVKYSDYKYLIKHFFIKLAERQKEGINLKELIEKLKANKKRHQSVRLKENQLSELNKTQYIDLKTLFSLVIATIKKGMKSPAQFHKNKDIDFSFLRDHIYYETNVLHIEDEQEKIKFMIDTLYNKVYQLNTLEIEEYIQHMLHCDTEEKFIEKYPIEDFTDICAKNYAIDHKTSLGNNLLNLSTAKGFNKIMLKLIEVGADFTIENNFGKSFYSLTINKTNDLSDDMIKAIINNAIHHYKEILDSFDSGVKKVITDKRIGYMSKWSKNTSPKNCLNIFNYLTSLQNVYKKDVEAGILNILLYRETTEENSFWYNLTNHYIDDPRMSNSLYSKLAEFMICTLEPFIREYFENERPIKYFDVHSYNSANTNNKKLISVILTEDSNEMILYSELIRNSLYQSCFREKFIKEIKAKFQVANSNAYQLYFNMFGTSLLEQTIDEEFILFHLLDIHEQTTLDNKRFINTILEGHNLCKILENIDLASINFISQLFKNENKSNKYRIKIIFENYIEKLGSQKISEWTNLSGIYANKKTLSLCDHIFSGPQVSNNDKITNAFNNIRYSMILNENKKMKSFNVPIESRIEYIEYIIDLLPKELLKCLSKHKDKQNLSLADIAFYFDEAKFLEAIYKKTDSKINTNDGQLIINKCNETISIINQYQPDLIRKSNIKLTM